MLTHVLALGTHGSSSANHLANLSCKSGVRQTESLSSTGNPMHATFDIAMLAATIKHCLLSPLLKWLNYYVRWE